MKDYDMDIKENHLDLVGVDYIDSFSDLNSSDSSYVGILESNEEEYDPKADERKSSYALYLREVSRMEVFQKDEILKLFERYVLLKKEFLDVFFEGLKSDRLYKKFEYLLFDNFEKKVHNLFGSWERYTEANTSLEEKLRKIFHRQTELKEFLLKLSPTYDLLKKMASLYSVEKSDVQNKDVHNITDKKKDFVKKENLDKILSEIRKVRKVISESMLKLVVSLANKYVNNKELYLEAIQEGNLALLHAIDKFDFRMNCAFSTYASFHIKARMYRYILNTGFMVKVQPEFIKSLSKIYDTINLFFQREGRHPTLEEIGKETGLSEKKVEEILKKASQLNVLSLDDPLLPDDDNEEFTLKHVITEANKDKWEETHEDIIRKETKKLIDEVLSKLSTREAFILRMRFGYGEVEKHTLEEIAKKLGLSKERVRQLEKTALKYIRRHIKNKEKTKTSYSSK